MLLFFLLSNPHQSWDFVRDSCYRHLLAYFTGGSRGGGCWVAEKDSHSLWNCQSLLRCHTVKLNQKAMKVIQKERLCKSSLRTKRVSETGTDFTFNLTLWKRISGDIQSRVEKIRVRTTIKAKSIILAQISHKDRLILFSTINHISRYYTLSFLSSLSCKEI